MLISISSLRIPSSSFPPASSEASARSIAFGQRRSIICMAFPKSSPGSWNSLAARPVLASRETTPRGGVLERDVSFAELLFPVVPVSSFITWGNKEEISVGNAGIQCKGREGIRGRVRLGYVRRK